MKTEIINLIRALKTATTYVDGHDKREKKLPDGVIYFVNGDREEICPFYHNEPYFSMNPFVLNKDGVINLSTWSCGPTVMNNGEIEEVFAKCIRDSIRPSSMAIMYIPLNKMASKEHDIHEVLHAVLEKGQYEDNAQAEKILHPIAIEDIQIHDSRGKKSAFVLKDGALRKLYVDGRGELRVIHHMFTDGLALKTA